jgi:hypothetical protein
MGKNPHFFTHIFNMKQMGEIKELLEDVSGKTLPDLRINNTVGKIEKPEITEEQRAWIVNRYQEDYDLFGKWIAGFENTKKFQYKANKETLIKQMEELKPWHQRVQVTPELNTDIFDRQYENRSMVNHRYSADFIYRVYKDSMLSKTMLDCGCNAGAHLYEAAKYGIKRGFGFDARESWINQAIWLKNNISIYNTDNIDFKVMNIYDVPKNNIGKYDVTMYSGLLYHVEDPFLSLKILSDVTNELLIVNTAFDKNHDQDVSKDCLYFKNESVVHPLSGVHGVSWVPSGERVIVNMLRPLGFKDFYLMFKRVDGNKDTGRLAIAASKIPNAFERLVREDEDKKQKIKQASGSAK